MQCATEYEGMSSPWARPHICRELLVQLSSGQTMITHIQHRIARSVIVWRLWDRPEPLAITGDAVVSRVGSCESPAADDDNQTAKHSTVALADV